MSDIQNQNSNLSFEDFKNENGITFWWASHLMVMLGYPNMKSFQKVLDRTTKALVSLNIPHYENIIAQENEGVQDFKLTRFACYMSVMNASPSKKEVAIAQAYFANQTRQFELQMQSSNELDRILIRDEIKEGNKSLSSTAQKAGVKNFANFQDAGYLGMYNMRSGQLKKKRKITKGTIMDNMGRTELAANLFRITQTEERIKNKNVEGQNNLEQTHYQVGKEVRKIVKENSGKSPENLPQEKKLPDVAKELKKGYRKMLKEDKKKK